MNKGFWYAIGAYGIWGFLPIYWKLLLGIPAIEILMHRTVWSLAFLIIILSIKNDWGWIKQAIKTPRTLIIYSGAALLLGFNWGLYIWAVNQNFIVEASLGYFINPLVSIFLGVAILRERMRPWQWVAIGVATSGVLFLTLSYGRLPWISLLLAFSFAIYGLIKKQAKLDAFRGLTLETSLLGLPALGYLIYLGTQGVGAFGAAGLGTTLLLAGTGVATAVPLLFFGAAAQRIPLSMIGILQYIAPTIQLLLGVFVYGEDFSGERVIGFIIIWSALVIYSFDSLLARRRLLMQTAKP